MKARIISRTRTPTSPFGGSPPQMNVSSNGGALKFRPSTNQVVVDHLIFDNLRGHRMISIRWIVDIDLKELVILLQRLDDPTACEDVVNLDVSKVQLSIEVREKPSGKGYDLQRSEVTSPLCGCRGSVFSKGVTLPPVDPVRALVVQGLGLL